MSDETDNGPAPIGGWHYDAAMLQAAGADLMEVLEPLAIGAETPASTLARILRNHEEVREREAEARRQRLAERAEHEKFAPRSSTPPQWMTLDIEIPGKAPWYGVQIRLDGEDITRRLKVCSIEMEPLDGPSRRGIVKLGIMQTKMSLTQVKSYIPREDLEWLATAHGYRLEIEPPPVPGQSDHVLATVALTGGLLDGKSPEEREVAIVQVTSVFREARRAWSLAAKEASADTEGERPESSPAELSQP